MFEVLAIGGGFSWRLICAAGRTLVYSDEIFPSEREAADAAKRYRAGFWHCASLIDHRQAGCI